MQVKEVARLVATTKRDHMVEAARVCTDGPTMVAAAEKVVEAAAWSRRWNGKWHKVLRLLQLVGGRLRRDIRGKQYR